ncbi:MAG: EamA family transporter [Candidatus Omnitrophica bacterium]|nr:EamA family transporter [Candidatus Omnitrophota bacterium]
MNAYQFAVLAACIWGVVPVLEKIGLTKAEPFTALFFRCLGVMVGLLFLGATMIRPAQLRAVEPKTIFILMVSGFLASFAAQIVFYHALKQGDVSRIVIIAGSYPMVSFILGILFLGEALTGPKAVGVLLVISGIWLLK